MMRAVMGLAWLTWRNLLAGKRAYAAFILLLIPAAVALVVARAGKPLDAAQIYTSFVLFYSLWFMIFLLALIFGLALTSGEIEEGTVGYVYLSAIPRWLIVLVQVAVASIMLTVACGCSLLLTALAANLAPLGPLPDLPGKVARTTLVAGVAIVVALSFYTTCGLAFRRPLAIAVAATFFWELVLTQMPIRFAAYTVTNNVRALVLNLVMEGKPARYFHYVKNYEFPSYGQAALFLSTAAGFFLVCAMVAVMNRSIEGKETR